MEDKIKFLLNALDKEITDIMYNKPKCDFEHIWNCAIDKCLEVINSYKDDDDYLEINQEKFKPTFDITDSPQPHIAIVGNVQPKGLVGDNIHQQDKEVINSQEKEKELSEKGVLKALPSVKTLLPPSLDTHSQIKKEIDKDYDLAIKEINKLRAKRDYWESKYKKLEEKK